MLQFISDVVFSHFLEINLLPNSLLTLLPLDKVKLSSSKTCIARSYIVVGCLSVKIQAIETTDSKHINHAVGTFSYPTKQAYFMILCLVYSMVLDSTTNK